jgi:exonuclease III
MPKIYRSLLKHKHYYSITYENGAYMRYIILLSGDVHTNPGPELKVCSINVRSLLAGVNLNLPLLGQYSKIDEIKSSILSEYDPDILALNETWLDEAIHDDILEINGYVHYRKDRNRNGGGVIIYVRSSLPSVHRKDLEPQNHEVIVIECKTGKKKIVLCNWYRPPNQNVQLINTFIDSFTSLVNNVTLENPDMFLCVGDYNDRCKEWLDEHTNSELGTKFVECVDELNLYQLVNQHTRVTINSAYILDLIITDSPSYISSVDVLDEIGTLDHKPVLCKVKFNYCNNKNIYREYWHYSNGDFASLNNELNTIPWLQIFDDYDDVNKTAEFITKTIIEVGKKHIPVRTVHYRTKDKPWFNNKIKKLIRLRNRWCGTYNRTKLPEHRQMRNEYRKLVKIEITKFKRLYVESLTNALSDPTIQCKRYWSIIKQLVGNKKKHGVPTLIENGKHYYTDNEKANLLCDYFTDQCTLPPAPNNYHLPNFQFKTNSRISTINIDKKMVRNKLIKLNTSKANGPDQISNRMLRDCSESLMEPFQALFSLCLSKGEYPSIWKKSNSSAVYKKNEDFIKINYRPISLLPCMSKVYEKLLFDGLYDYCIMNELLTDRNSGFKQLDCTINQLVHIVHCIYQGIDSKHNVCSVFLDISKAFDKVYHEGLIFKLKQIGIIGNLLSLLKSYLCDRYHRVVINGSSSDWRPVNAGVPQGSILGPLLFLIYINDIVDQIVSNIYIFADDTSLMTFIDPLDIAGTFATINNDLQKLYEWSLQWRVDFNAMKSTYIIFSKTVPLPQYPQITMGGKVISQVDHHKHLGIILNSKMTWSKHVDYICEKASRRCNSMKRISSIVPRRTLIHLYKSIVRPVLEYGCVLYDNIDQVYINKIERVQRSAALVCTGGYSLTSNECLLNELGWDKLETRRSIFRLVLFYKILNNLTPEYLRHLIPQQINQRSQYNLRNSNDFCTIHCRLSCYYRSYFPKSIRDWNNLTPETKNSQSLGIFRKKVNKLFNCKNYNKLFNLGHGIASKSISRIRMGLSPLRGNLYKIKVVESPICEYCDTGYVEDHIHYLLYCPAFDNFRIELFSNIIEYVPVNTFEDLTDAEIVRLLLNGFQNIIGIKDTENIYRKVLEFIINTKRFTNLFHTDHY